MYSDENSCIMLYHLKSALVNLTKLKTDKNLSKIHKDIFTSEGIKMQKA